MRTRHLLIWLGLFVVCGVLLFIWRPSSVKEPIRVGILHALTGTMSTSETPVSEAALLAVEEINSRGGIIGRRIEAVISDTRSDSLVAAEEARRLIEKEQVRALFGCWTSDCRKTVRPVIEELHHLLFYPVQHEGLELSPRIFYLGSIPNQQIIPATKWSFDHLGKRFFLAGSDYVFPRTANEIIKDVLRDLDAEVTGEEYLLLGSDDVETLVQKIAAAQPDVVLNTINGNSNIAFFKALKQSGLLSQGVKVMSFSIAESEVLEIGPDLMEGQYAAWNYFQSLPGDLNREFVAAFKKKYGQDRVISDPMEAAYNAVRLWAQAVEEAGTADPRVVRKVLLKNQSIAAPSGIISIDAQTQHVWKSLRIGKIKRDGQFEVLWSSAEIAPIPYPIWRSEAEWNQYLEQLFLQWGNRWAKPSDSA